ncbi:hypothetical protein AVEN_190228-1 [Araneus ventricosus]|uniref:Uncharacterized protein n=1 Tax=Araneus ventricosus TaxID=182803 RepID=A0A4Y2FC42_ARAVE|nr:hypothetical protein AVEN_190228-1 [Araneus ventricosus]
MILAKGTHYMADCRLHRYCIKSLKGTLDSAVRPKLLPSRSEGSFGDSFPRILDHLDAGIDVKVIFPKFSESKTGLFMVSSWLIDRYNDMSKYKFGKMCDHKRSIDASGTSAKHGMM